MQVKMEVGASGGGAQVATGSLTTDNTTNKTYTIDTGLGSSLKYAMLSGTHVNDSNNHNPIFVDAENNYFNASAGNNAGNGGSLAGTPSSSLTDVRTAVITDITNGVITLKSQSNATWSASWKYDWVAVG